MLVASAVSAMTEAVDENALNEFDVGYGASSCSSSLAGISVARPVAATALAGLAGPALSSHFQGFVNYASLVKGKTWENHGFSRDYSTTPSPSLVSKSLSCFFQSKGV